MEQIIQKLLNDNDSLLTICGSEYEYLTEYQSFTRCLSDQTVVENDKRRLRTKEDRTMNSSALQNPSDPDAAYRNKGGKLDNIDNAIITKMYCEILNFLGSELKRS